MILSKIKLMDFRCYPEKTIEFDEGTTWIVGPNAVGKTNILEAIRMISTGESFKAKRIDETVRFEGEYAKIEAKLSNGKEKMDLGILLTRGELQGKRVSKRRFFIDNVAKKRSDFLGHLSSVTFRPEDLELMEGSPAVRRDFLNDVLIQVDREYARSLSTYEQAIRRRNKILEAIREGVANRHQLTFWDGLIIRHGQRLTDGRESLVEYINEIWQKSDLFNLLQIVYNSSIISEKRLEQYEKEEVAAGYTLVGPHKDDFQIVSQPKADAGERDIGIYGSRGEQRMAVLGLKMGELLFLEEKLGSKPLLLLDDIFSELDENHIKEVRRVMLNRQVVVTTTDKADAGKDKKVRVVELTYGDDKV